MALTEKRQNKRFELYLLLVMSLLLIALSVVGSLLGVDGDTEIAEKLGIAGARRLFTSLPLALFWTVLAVLFLASLLFYPRILRNVGLLALHLGPLLILVGAMWGSEQGHRLAGMVFGNHKVAKGYMQLYPGEPDNMVYDKKGEAIGHLPFSLALNEFRIEYYPAKDLRWDLVVELPVSAPGQSPQFRTAQVNWKSGAETDIPFTEATVKVLQFIERARPVYAPDKQPKLLVTTAGGETVKLPAEVGSEFTLAGEDSTVRIVRALANLRVVGSGPERRIIDDGGIPQNPALEVEIVDGDGQKRTHYPAARMPAHGHGHGHGHGLGTGAALVLNYEFPEPVAAEADPQSPVPAMEVLITDESGGQRRHWFLPKASENYVGLPLQEPVELVGPVNLADHQHPLAVPHLFLVRPAQEISAYLSDIVVQDQGQMVQEKTIAVNHPLHYGGYHFYQSSYDTEEGRYSVLSVTSDSGWPMVFVGFVLLIGGALWQSWVVPVSRYVRRRRAENNG